MISLSAKFVPTLEQQPQYVALDLLNLESKFFDFPSVFCLRHLLIYLFFCLLHTGYELGTPTNQVESQNFKRLLTCIFKICISLLTGFRTKVWQSRTKVTNLSAEHSMVTEKSQKESVPPWKCDFSVTVLESSCMLQDCGLSQGECCSWPCWRSC